MKNQEHVVRTTVNGEPKEDVVISSIFEDCGEAAAAVAESEDLLGLLNSAIITRDKNAARAAMRPADPKAEFNRTKNSIIEQLLRQEISDKEAIKLIKDAASARDAALAGE